MNPFKIHTHTRTKQESDFEMPFMTHILTLSVTVS